MADDLAAFGLVAEWESDVEIWPENIETVEIFLACRTQWRRDAMNGSLLGLRYADVAATLDMMAVGDRKEVFGGIRVMEAEALEVLNTKRKP